MMKEQRQQRILSELAQRGAVSVVDAARLLGVSEATIRRDLDELARQGKLRRTHGGAVALEHHEELPFNLKAISFAAEKRRIGAAAAALIQPGQVIGCTGGTTVAHVAKALRGKRVVVVTNAINIAVELAASEETEVIVSGGSLRSRSLEMVGHVAERTFRELYVDVAIMGVDGISLEHGLTTYHLSEAHTNRVLIEQAREVWVVADHSKVDKVTPAFIGPLSLVRRFITDTEAPAAFLEELRLRGIEVISV
ncbi:MAG TPA: DeoR/GlpR family DNA-binding transcription regulator [Limnochordales bacterium]|nr:DeoR/GlpR family DNA-binding transcription regulator [Limnochordales bacterium]